LSLGNRLPKFTDHYIISRSRESIIYWRGVNSQ